MARSSAWALLPKAPLVLAKGRMKEINRSPNPTATDRE
jgi:hypothetical protein